MSARAFETRIIHLTPTLVTVSATNVSSKPLQILIWNTPLDPLALPLDLFTITNLNTGKEEAIGTAGLKVQRKLPPEDDAFVTLAPGENIERQHRLVGSSIKAGESYRVSLEWIWMGHSNFHSKDAGSGLLSAEQPTEKVEIKLKACEEVGRAGEK